MIFTESDMTVVARHMSEISSTYSRAQGIFEDWSSPCEQYRREQHWKHSPEQEREFLQFVEEWTVSITFDTGVVALQQAVVFQLGAECDSAILCVPTNRGKMYVVNHTYSLQDEDGREALYEGIFVGKVFMEVDHAVLSWQNQLEGSNTRFHEQGYGIAKPYKFDSTELIGTKFMLCTRYCTPSSETESTRSTRSTSRGI